MPNIPVPSGSLYYSEHGEGPLVVLAHGVGGNHAIWHKQVAVLARTYRVVAFDHRGFGLSVDQGGLGRAAFADDLLALLDSLQADKAALVGQSMGGGTCIAFAGLHPERVAALVVASSLHALAEPDDVKPIMDEARAQTQDLDQLQRVLSDGFREAQPAQAVLYQEINSFNLTDRRSLGGAWPLVQTPEALGALGFPKLFIGAALDRLFPIEAVRRTQARVAGSFMVEIDDAGHSAFFERPDEFNDSLLSFLAMAGIKGRARPAHSNTAGYQPVGGKP